MDEYFRNVITLLFDVAQGKVAPASYVHILQPGDSGAGHPIVLGLKLKSPPIDDDNHNAAQQANDKADYSTASTAADSSTQLADAELYVAETALEQGPSVQSGENPEAGASRTLDCLANGPADLYRRCTLAKEFCVTCTIQQLMREAEEEAAGEEVEGKDLHEAEDDG